MSRIRDGAVVVCGEALTRSLARSRAGPRGAPRLDDVEQAARFACRVAALTCARAGADPSRLGELGLPPG